MGAELLRDLDLGLLVLQGPHLEEDEGWAGERGAPQLLLGPTGPPEPCVGVCQGWC